MDKETEAIVSEIKALLEDLRGRGITEDMIDSLVSEKKAGRVVMERGGLRFPDLDGAMIRLNPMERTLYTLVMRYTDGVPSDELWRFYDELCGIYALQTVYDDPELIRNAIEAVCDEYKTTLYTNVSRIKKKLTDKLGKRVAEPYLITRDTAGKYRIGISRDLVSGF